LELLLAVLLPAAIGLGIVAPHIANVMLGEAYRTAATAIIPILALAFLMHMLSQQYVQLSFSLADRPSLYALHTGGILLANALLIAPLIRLYDLPGAALSFLIAETFGVVLGLLMSTRTYRLPLIPRRALRVLVATAGMAMVAWFLRVVVDRTDLIGLFAIVLPAMASYLILLVALDVFDARRRLSGLIARRNMRKRAAQ
jgi:O-antigen/teichoic acid export membrane protein